jgi:hypothetical protein
MAVMVPRWAGRVAADSSGETFAPPGHNTEVIEPSPDVALRLQRRYPPPRVPRTAKIVLVGVGVAIALGWLIWAALTYSRPQVAAQVSGYVVSDTSIKVTFTVERPDPSRAVTCRVIAQSADFQTVGEQQVPVAATEAKLVDVTIEVKTFRRATSASVKGCTVV